MDQTLIHIDIHLIIDCCFLSSTVVEQSTVSSKEKTVFTRNEQINIEFDFLQNISMMDTSESMLVTDRIPSSRPRFILSEPSAMHMIKLERGLVKRSLLYCLERGYFSLVRYLIESGHGNLRERDREGRTVLIYCCFIESDCWADHMAMFLLEHGARIVDRDHQGLNALHYAILKQRYVLVKRFLSSLDFDLHRSIDIHGNTCLHYACSTGHLGIVRLILDTMKRYAIDLNIKNHLGLTSSDIACQFNHRECQNLIQNEILAREQEQRSLSTFSNATTSIKSFKDRGLPSLAQIRPRTSTATSQFGTSAVSIPTHSSPPPPALMARKQSISTSHVSSTSTTQSISILIDPLQNRFVPLKHNAQLDHSLVHQFKLRSDFQQRSYRNSAVSLNESSNTWRSDFTKMYQQLQTDKTPSYRQSFETLSAIQAAQEAATRAQQVTTGGGKQNPKASSQITTSSSTSGPLKTAPQRRNSITSIKSSTKTKKVNFN